MRRVALTCIAVAAGLALLTLFAACSEPPKLVGEGAACAVTTDCQLGLVCIPQQSGARICTGDVTSIAKATQRPVDAGRADGDAGEGGEGGEGGSDASEDAPITPLDSAVTD